MQRSISQARMLAGAGLILLIAGGLLAWKAVANHSEAFAAAGVTLDKRTRERDGLARDLATERQRLHALEQMWSARLERAQSQKNAAEERLRECEGRGEEILEVR